MNLENPQSDKLWNCNIFPFYLPEEGGAKNLAECHTNIGDTAQMVEVNKDQGLNNIETETAKGFNNGIGGFLCNCTNVEGGALCDFPERDIFV